MKRYKYIGTEEQLVERGYGISKYGYASKRTYHEEVFINIGGHEPKEQYGEKNEIKNMDIRVDMLDTKLIQDLIDAGLVEVVE